jgi:hypothetical protein
MGSRRRAWSYRTGHRYTAVNRGGALLYRLACACVGVRVFLRIRILSYGVGLTYGPDIGTLHAWIE